MTEKKKKILFISDHPLSTSGVGIQARWLINGLLNTGKYTFRCLGAAVKHNDYQTVSVNPDFIIKPIDGFGDRNMLRVLLATEKPDALFLFTDPRFFIWTWEMEDEIHQICPIVYNHLWDNDPWPDFNKVLYESTDLINCINYPTYKMVHERFPEKTNFIPHALPSDIYQPFPEDKALDVKRKLLGDARSDHFVGLYVSRNARRKMPSDLIQSWKIFLDQLEATHGHRKATLVMHTDPNDHEGPNLHHVIDLFGLRGNVFFSKDRVGFEEMVSLYNTSDVVLNRSCNEGFGLSTLEGLYCGKPMITIKTGGLTRQVINWETGEEYGVGLDPEVRSLVGNQMVPYIYEDFVSHKTYADAIMKVYNMGPEGRKTLGLRGRDYAMKEFSIDRLIGEWDRTLQDTMNSWSQKSKWSEVVL